MRKHSHPGVRHEDLNPSGLLAHIADHLHSIDRKLNLIMATQADIDTLTTQIASAVSVLTTETTELSSAVDEIVAWINANPGLDTSGLDAAVAALTTSTNAIKAASDAASAVIPDPA
jgi:hypothetical protein